MTLATHHQNGDKVGDSGRWVEVRVPRTGSTIADVRDEHIVRGCAMKLTSRKSIWPVTVRHIYLLTRNEPNGE